MNMTKDKPERLFSDLADFFGTQEACRILRVDGPTLSKMKSSPDDRNLENSNHRYSFLEKVVWAGHALTLTILDAEQESENDRLRKAKELQRRCGRFTAECFGGKYIPNDEVKTMQEILKRVGMILLTFTTAVI